jgi:hypothetical protein
MDKLRLLVETYYDYQKGRIAYYNRLNRFPEEIRSITEKETVFSEIAKNMEKLEKSLINAMKKELEKDELYTKVLSRIKGIGVVLSADLIAWLCRERDFTIANSHPMFEQIKKLPYAKIEKIDEKQSRVILPPVLDVAKYPSDLYKYCGLIPKCRRVKGEQISYNPKLKTLFWKVARQILLARKSFYCTMYNMEKAKFMKKYENVKEGSGKLLAHLTAIKKVSRHLALTIYLAYKHIKKQPKYLPYPIEVLKHGVEPPFVDGENGKPEYLEFLIEKSNSK